VFTIDNKSKLCIEQLDTCRRLSIRIEWLNNDGIEVGIVACHILFRSGTLI
jgi:hypothetical protein